MLNNYTGLFSDDVGTFAGPKVRIHVSADAQPLFHEARPVPYMMRSMIECELDHLQGEKINLTSRVLRLGSTYRSNTQSRWNSAHLWGLQNDNQLLFTSWVTPKA